jgi:hypothetical protein
LINEFVILMICGARVTHLARYIGGVARELSTAAAVRRSNSTSGLPYAFYIR